MIPSPNFSARGNSPVRLLVIHTTEGALTAQSLGAYFAQSSTGASSHVGIDAAGIEQYVAYDKAAWTVRAGNPISDNAELCAYAALTREQWLSDSEVTFYHQELKRFVKINRPRQILLNAATWAAERCRARGIPAVKLTPAEVAAGKAGIIGHVDWTVGMRDGSHQDPGAGFPWPEFIAAVAQKLNPSTAPPEEDDMSFQAIPFTLPAGVGAQKFVLPVGAAVSAATVQGWFSFACDGVINQFEIWWQNDKGGVGSAKTPAYVKGNAGKDARPVFDIPEGATQWTFHYVATGPVGATIEIKAKNL